MKKQDYIDQGLSSGLTLPQIENILCKILGISKEQLFSMNQISSKYIYEIQKYFYDIASGKPEEYTLGSTNFYGRDFYVSGDVLIPRNDTEILVQKTLSFLTQSAHLGQMSYIDVGTGSGAIAVSVIEEVLPLKFAGRYALDISSKALEVAKKNIANLTQESVTILESNLLEALIDDTTIVGQKLVITANLPYIKNDDRAFMDTSVYTYEPAVALYGGEKTGFELYKKLLKQCFEFKIVKKIQSIDLFIEIGFDQRDISEQVLKEFGLEYTYFNDSSGIYRVIHIYNF